MKISAPAPVPDRIERRTLAGWLADAYGDRFVPGRIGKRRANTLIEVSAGAKVYWLRASTGVDRDFADVESEAAVVAALRERRLRVAAPVLRRDRRYAGSLMTSSGPCAAVLFQHAPGEIMRRLSPEQSRALGRLVAGIHSAGADLFAVRPALDYDALVLAPLRRLEQWLRKHRLPRARLRAIANEMVARAGFHHGPIADAVLCHGDLHPGNASFAGRRPTLFDFEVCGGGPRPYDLACYWRKRIFVARDRAAASREWGAFLTGYGSIQPLDPSTMKTIPALATLRAIWVMAMPAAPAARWGTSWLADRGYFEAHIAIIERFAERARRA